MLLTHEEWSARARRSDEEAWKRNSENIEMRSWGRGRSRGHARGRRGRGIPSTVHQEGSSRGNRDKKHIKCFNCDKLGHYASECWNERRGEEVNLVHDEESALMLTVAQGEIQSREKNQDVVMLNEEEVIPELHSTEMEQLHTHTWYLDNGASNRMSGDRGKFQRLDESITGMVKFGDGSTIDIMGKGSVLLKCKNGDHRVLQEVYYIPRLRSNIISLGQMTEDGNELEMTGEYLKVYDESGALLMSVRRSPNRLYKIQLETCDETYLMASFDNPAWLWHARLGHINFHTLKLIGEK